MTVHSSALPIAMRSAVFQEGTSGDLPRREK
jgi:hypothetical protein